MLLATFVYVACIAMLIASRYREQLVKTAQLGLLITIVSLPPYAVRAVYLMLVEFGDVKFDPVVGDWRFLASLGFAMEVVIVVLLVVAGVVVEPFWVGREFAGRLPMAENVQSADVNVKTVSSVG